MIKEIDYRVLRQTYPQLTIKVFNEIREKVKALHDSGKLLNDEITKVKNRHPYWSDTTIFKYANSNNNSGLLSIRQTDVFIIEKYNSNTDPLLFKVGDEFNRITGSAIFNTNTKRYVYFTLFNTVRQDHLYNVLKKFEYKSEILLRPLIEIINEFEVINQEIIIVRIPKKKSLLNKLLIYLNKFKSYREYFPLREI